MPTNKEKILIFAFGAKGLKSAQGLSTNLTNDGKTPVIITNHPISKNGSEGIVTFKDCQSHIGIKYHNVLDDTHRFIENLKQLKISNQQTFQDIAIYKNVSLLDMSTQYLLSELFPFIQNSKLIKEIIGSQNPDRIIILGNAGRLFKIIKNISTNKGITLQFGRPVTLYFLEQINKARLTLDCFLRRVLRFLKSIYFKLHNNFDSRKVRYDDNGLVLFFCNAERNLDVLLSIITKYLPEERVVVVTLSSGCEGRLKKENIDFKYFYGYKVYNFFSLKKERYLRNIWQMAARRFKAQHQLYGEDFFLWDILEGFFYHLIFEIFSENIRQIELMEEIASQVRIKAVVVVDYCSQAVLPARSLSIPTISVLPYASDSASYYRGMIADYFSATSHYWKEYLVSCGVSPERIFLAGPTKFDSVMNTKFDRDNILKKLNLDVKKKTVIYAGVYPTNAMGGFTHDDYIHELRMVFRSFRDLNGINLIAKLHPYDSNFDVHRYLAKEEGLENILIIRDFDIWELLYCSDLIITNGSTVGYEGLLMDKPLISLQRIDKNIYFDMWNLEKFNVAFFIDDYSQLNEAIKQVLFDPTLQERLSANRRKYIFTFASPLDGMASKRVKEFIDKSFTLELNK